MDQQEHQQEQKLKHQILQYQQLRGQWRQDFQDMQRFRDMQQSLENGYLLDMTHSHYILRRQPVQMTGQPQPQSVPVYPVPRPSNYSQGYIFNYGTVLVHGNSSPVMARAPSTSSVDQGSCTSQEDNRPTSDIQRDVHNERRHNNGAPYSSQGSIPNSIGPEGITSVLSTSTADSCTSREENSPIPDHQEDEAVNESRDVRISRQDILKIRDALVNLNSVVKDLQEENAELKHFLSIKSQEEDIESYLQEIQQLVQNNLENQVSDSSQDSVPNSAGQG